MNAATPFAQGTLRPRAPFTTPASARCRCSSGTTDVLRDEMQFVSQGIDNRAHLLSQQQLGSLSRRGVLEALALLSIAQPAWATVDVEKVTIRMDLTPDQSKYDPSDPDLRAAARLVQDALAAPTVQEEEALWTQIIEDYGSKDGDWVPDLVGRAWGNRGNARSRQGKLEAAVRDYNKAIELCPWSADPVLNRGAVLEQLGRFEEAVEDYRSILAVDDKDPAAWNNLGNANMGLGNWNEAVEYFTKAAALSPVFSFASANRVVALFQAGRKNDAIRDMRTILRKYPDFPDTRAALTAALWSVGKEGDAETNWQRVSDPRYRDKQWLMNDRRWPPALVSALTAFLEVRSVG